MTRFVFAVVAKDDYNDHTGATSKLPCNTPSDLAIYIEQWQRKIADAMVLMPDLPTVWNSQHRVFLIAVNNTEAVIAYKDGYE